MGTQTNEVIAVAIDFGTTYSAVAFAQLNVENPIPIQIGDWPGQVAGGTSYAVPTVVVYPDKGGPSVWGFEAENSEDKLYPKFRIFKPFIEPSSMIHYRTPPGITLKDVVHDYIQGLYDHLIEHITGKRIYSPNNTKLDILLTVPAAYSNSTVENFRRIVATTGIGNHTFGVRLTEPEAAALYTVESMGLKRPEDIPSWKKNDCFIVCDAGGGTVDIASYTVLRLNPSIQVAHTGVISGSYCGSTIIDREFTSYIKQEIADNAKTRPLIERLNKDFIIEKERFNNSLDEESFHIFFGNKDQLKGVFGDEKIKLELKNGYLSISRTQMHGFFAKSLNETKGLLANHIKQCAAGGYRVGAIFLVGGLGSSPYTKQQVEDYAQEIDFEIRVYQPPDAQQAVVRGALTKQIQMLKELEDPVQSRLCRKHYGLVTMKPFSETTHFDYERYVDPLTGNVLAKNQIEWLIRKNESFSGANEKCIEKVFKRDFLPSKLGYRWKEVIVECSHDNPPFRVEPGVTQVCTLVPDLTSCQVREFEKIKKKKGNPFAFKSSKYYHARYKIKIFIGSVGVRSEMFYRDEPRPDLMAVLWPETEEKKENDERSN
ncbi:hypothetical protein P167DRAFT_566804 [Morchella conica CCBAS932]|uniref:Actin-like ATPase domain-containing protein n=1 Tax=Morchella conica CCBAS932 TaxID=1392247 RepID=A0A3N4KWJ9_9PEZI|nr:hypothetical protein P167DRAFT_566804 [Morchella conica CCBAS932]